MLLNYPAVITPRLLAGVHIGEAYISIEYSARAGRDGRTRYRYYIDLPDGSEHSDDDIQSGCQGGNLQTGLSSLLLFLGACAESINYSQRTGRTGENIDLFPENVGEWAAQNSDDITLAQLELDECAHAIDERSDDERDADADDSDDSDDDN